VVVRKGSNFDPLLCGLSPPVFGILGHSRIQTTLDLYTDEDLDEMIAAQEKFLDAVGFEAGSVQ